MNQREIDDARQILEKLKMEGLPYKALAGVYKYLDDQEAKNKARRGK